MRYTFVMKKFIITFYLLLSLLFGAFVLLLFGFYGFTISDSMEPTEPIGSFTFINPFERNIEVGDIVGYRCYTFSKCPKTYTSLITHRLVKIENGCYHFWGDNPAYIWDDPIHNPCLLREDFVLYGVEHLTRFSRN